MFGPSKKVRVMEARIDRLVEDYCKLFGEVEGLKVRVSHINIKLNPPELLTPKKYNVFADGEAFTVKADRIEAGKNGSRNELNFYLDNEIVAAVLSPEKVSFIVQQDESN